VIRSLPPRTSGVSRRRLCLAAAAGAPFLLQACKRKDGPGPAASHAAVSDEAPSNGKPEPGSLEWAVAGDWRSAEDRARDVWRHPVESLRFWGLKPGTTVVEFWPGLGWYADILAPYLARSDGKLIEVEFAAPGDAASAKVMDVLRRKLAARPGLFGQPTLGAFGPKTGPVAPAGSADLVLFARTVHDWMAAGLADKAFRDAFAALKPGGVLGVEENRAAPGDVQDPLASDGYVQESYVKQLAMEAGFRFDGASEINANPKDDRHHPFGVWTLPPTRRAAPASQPDDAKFDHRPYDAIGESDRMTLRFVKPA